MPIDCPHARPDALAGGGAATKRVAGRRERMHAHSGIESEDFRFSRTMADTRLPLREEDQRKSVSLFRSCAEAPVVLRMVAPQPAKSASATTCKLLLAGVTTTPSPLAKGKTSLDV